MYLDAFKLFEETNLYYHHFYSNLIVTLLHNYSFKIYHFHQNAPRKTDNFHN